MSRAEDMNTRHEKPFEAQGNGIDLRRAYRALINGYIEAAIRGRIRIGAEYTRAYRKSRPDKTKGDDEQRKEDTTI